MESSTHRSGGHSPPHRMFHRTELENIPLLSERSTGQDMSREHSPLQRTYHRKKPEHIPLSQNVPQDRTWEHSPPHRTLQRIEPENFPRTFYRRGLGNIPLLTADSTVQCSSRRLSMSVTCYLVRLSIYRLFTFSFLVLLMNGCFWI